MNDLPVEILQNILLVFAKKKGARILLISVCRYWRQLVESTPEFWNWITITKRLPKDLEVWRRNIARAGDMPLDVLWSIPASEEVDQIKLQSVLKAIPFRRWGSVRFCVGPGSSIDLLEGEFDNLTYLEVRASVEVWDPLLLLIEKTAHKLRTLVINEDLGGSTHMDGLFNRVDNLKCRALTEFSFTNEPEELFDFPRDLPPRITHLELRFFPTTPWNFTSVVKMYIGVFNLHSATKSSFPNVEIFTIVEIPDAAVHDMGEGDRVYFPKLRTMIYQCGCWDPLLFFVAPLLDTIRCSSPHPIYELIKERKSNQPSSVLLKGIKPTNLELPNGIGNRALIDVLYLFPHVTRLDVMLGLIDWRLGVIDTPQNELRDALVAIEENDKDGIESNQATNPRAKLMPHLAQLRVDVSARATDYPPFWRKLMGDLFEIRRPTLRSLTCLLPKNETIVKVRD